jgi:molybdenum cofactor sulfurtransferase
LKILAESFNFGQQTNQEKIDTILEQPRNSTSKPIFAYLNDNHTSVIGMREIVWQNSCADIYCLTEEYDLELEPTSQFSFEAKKLERFNYLNCNKYDLLNQNYNYNLLVYPAQSNFNGRKYSLSLIEKIKKNDLVIRNIESLNDCSTIDKSKWFVCLDSASFVCTSQLDLSIYKPDFLVISFYKIFGFPTGIGCLLIKKDEDVKSCLNGKKYFGGGTLAMALIDENKFCFHNCTSKSNEKTYSIMKYSYHEFLEDGTLPYLDIIAVSLAIDKFEKLTFNIGFKLIESYMDYLTKYCFKSLTELIHFNRKPLVEIYRKSYSSKYGPIIAFNLKDSSGNYIGYTLVNKLAQENSIHLRTGFFNCIKKLTSNSNAVNCIIILLLLFFL